MSIKISYYNYDKADFGIDKILPIQSLYGHYTEKI